MRREKPKLLTKRFKTQHGYSVVATQVNSVDWLYVVVPPKKKGKK